jgi:hypothetical protein
MGGTRDAPLCVVIDCSPMRLPREPWLDLLPADPRLLLLESAEPWARFTTLTKVLGMAERDEPARSARAAVTSHPAIRSLVQGLPAWGASLSFGGHNSPAFPPNILRLLHSLGVRAGDFPRVERILDAMLRRQAGDGRFLTPGATTGAGKAAWTSLPCDHFAILEVLLLYGRDGTAEVAAGLERVRDTFGATAQGRGWLCIPDPAAKWRGPGRKGDACPQVTLEALRLFSLVSSSRRPRGIVEAARTLLRAWRCGSAEKPYMFGHGKRFVDGKWPPTWYDASAVLEALAAYPSAWKWSAAPAADRRSAVEIVRALASAIGPDGLVTPRSCFKGFEDWSFGQKKTPSPWATARLCGVLRPFSSLAPFR